jgi:hypothetical protein
MIKVDIDGLRDFQACTLFYKFKYNDEIKKPSTTSMKTQALFKDTLITIVNFFFFKKMKWEEPSYKALENRWEKLWLKDVSPDDLFYLKTSHTNSIPTDTHWTVKAAKALLEFHRWFANKPGQEVVMFDEPFTVPLNSEVALESKFDLVLRSGKADNYKYHIYTWSVNMGNKSADYWTAHFTALDYAFRYRNNFPEDVQISHHLWDFTDAKPGAKEFLIESKDYAMLKMWADNMAQNKQYYPIRGLSAYCRACKFNKPCLAWTPVEAEPKKKVKR